MKTLAFYAVFGVVPGYNHGNDVDLIVVKENGVENLQTIRKTPVQIVSEAWQKAMQEEFDTTENLVAAVLYESRTIYPIGFGCPKGGEVTVTVNGHLNPNFIPDKGHAKDMNYLLGLCDYREAVIRVCEAIKLALNQTTVSIGFYEIQDFVYLTSKE